VGLTSKAAHGAMAVSADAALASFPRLANEANAATGQDARVTDVGFSIASLAPRRGRFEQERPERTNPCCSLSSEIITAPNARSRADERGRDGRVRQELAAAIVHRARPGRARGLTSARGSLFTRRAPCPRTLNLRNKDKHVGPCALTEAEGREYDRWLLAKESRPAKRRRDHRRSSAVRYQRG